VAGGLLPETATFFAIRNTITSATTTTTINPITTPMKRMSKAKSSAGLSVGV